MTTIKDPIPSGPFQRWLNDRAAESSAPQVVALVGWDDPSEDAGLRRLYRYRHARSETNRGGSNGRKGKRCVVHSPHFERAVVEDALDHAGVDLADVYPREMYPALFEDIPLEEEQWCPSCQDSCTPIYGVCPFCEWSFRKKLAA
jgi:hypothetical protein